MVIKEKAYLQVFNLSEIIKYGKKKQNIIHSQEQPEFKEEFIISTKVLITEKIYIINDGLHTTMMLYNEYYFTSLKFRICLTKL